MSYQSTPLQLFEVSPSTDYVKNQFNMTVFPANESTNKQNSLVPVTDERVLDLINLYVSSLDASKSTKRTYKNGVKRFFSWLAANNINQSALTVSDVVNYKNYLADLDIKYRSKVLYLKAMIYFCEWWSKNTGQRNLAADISPWKDCDVVFETEPVTSDDRRRMLEAIDRSTVVGLRDYALILTLMTTGLRHVSIAHAINSDIIPDIDGKLILRYRKKGSTAKLNEIALVPVAVQAIVRYREKAALYYDGKKSSRTVKTYELNADDPLFPGLGNKNWLKKMSERHIARIVKDVMVASGIDMSNKSPHSLRHGFAETVLDKSGGDLSLVSRLMGHSNEQITKVYTKKHLRTADRKSSELYQDHII